MRRLLTVRRGSAVLLAVAMALTGCSSGADEAEDGIITIRYTNFSANAGNEENLQAMVDAFESANPTIKIETEILPYGDYFTALQTSIAGGTVGDTFELNYESFAQYAGSGAILPIQDVPSGVYSDSLLEGFRYEGQQMGLPLSYSALVMVYNRDLFEAAGIAAPTADWTWEDERAAAQALTDPDNGVFGNMQSASYHEFYKAIVQAGGRFLTEDGKRAAFNTPAGVTAANWLLEKYGTVMATEAQGLGTPDFDKNLFQDGKLAMWHTGMWMFGPLSSIDVDWDIVPEPAGPGGEGSGMFANGVFISKTTDHPEEAERWLEFLSGSTESMTIRIDAAWELPPTTDEATLATYLAGSPPANRQAVIQAMRDGVLPPVIVRGQEVQDVVQAELNAARDGNKSVEQALGDAERAVNELLAD